MSDLEVADVEIGFVRDQAQSAFIAATDVSFTCSVGEFVSIVGPSGCGKSSLLNIIGGLLAPMNGDIRLGGKPIRGPGTERAIVFQDASLLPWRTAERNVAYGLELNGIADAEASQAARSALDLVGLGGKERSWPRELSGGMQQRVNLARALVMNPTLLLCDEPFGALDALTRAEMQEELLDIWNRKRMTVVFITHDIDEAVLLSDRVLVMGGKGGNVNPGTILADLQVPLKRPRDRLTVQSERGFLEVTQRIWEMIHKMRD